MNPLPSPFISTCSRLGRTALLSSGIAAASLSVTYAATVDDFALTRTPVVPRAVTQLVEANQTSPSDIDEIEVIARTGPCRPAVAHTPAPDVTFNPGISATGKAVAPADLTPDATPTLPDTISFDMLVTPPTDNGVRLEGTIGKIKTDLSTGATTILDRTYAPADTATTCNKPSRQ